MVKPTTKRYGILALVFITVVINYMDRSNISVAAFALREDLNISTIQMGLIFSAFAWTYSTMQIPGGIMADIYKPRVLYAIILSLWSLATLIQGLVSSMSALIGCRAAIGLFESPSYPTNNRIVTKWFPEKERASAIAVYTSGQFIGLAFLTPALVAIQTFVGWRGLFIVSGLVGLIWAIIWYLFYRDPQSHKGANQAEINLIKEGGAVEDQTEKKSKVDFNWKDLKQAFIYRKLWGVYIGQFCLGGLFIFFLTWFPTYLVEYRGLDFLQSGFLASIPFIAAFFGVLTSGFLSDYLVRIGMSNEFARKTPVLTGMLLSVFIIGANYTASTPWVIFFLALAFFGNGLASITWIFISIMAPARNLGIVGGVFNFIGGLSAVITPIVIGYLVKEGDFRPALLFIGLLAFAGFLSYLFLVGKVERLNN